MKHERIVHNAFNYGFTTLYNDFTEPFLKSLGAPGKFVRKANTSVRTQYGKSGDIDSAYVADPDYEKIFVQTVVLLGHQRLPVNEDKSEVIALDYFIQGVSDERLPAMVCIASHHDTEKHVQSYGINKDNVIINFYFLDLGEEDNAKRLNKIRSKLNTSDMISIEDGMNIGITQLFAPEKYAKEITRELLDYFLNRKIESNKLKNALYRVFYAMIDAYFDDENEFQEMITMLKKDMSYKDETRLESDIIREKMLNEVLEKNTKLNESNTKLSEKNTKLNESNTKLTEEKEHLCNLTNQLLSDLEDSPHTDIKKLLDYYKPLYNGSLQRT